MTSFQSARALPIVSSQPIRTGPVLPAEDFRASAFQEKPGPLRFVAVSLCALAAVALHAASSPKTSHLVNTSYLRDHAETRGFMLGRPGKAVPTPDGKAVLFLRSQARVPKLELYEFDVATGQTRVLLTPEQVLKGDEEELSPEEKARRERMRVSVGGFTDFQLSSDGNQILLSLSGKLYLVPRATGEAKQLKTGEGTLVDPKFSPDGRSLAYVLDRDVFVFDLATQTERRVTTGGTDELRHGLAEFVAQEEMERFSGYWWSPDSRFIAYEESDHEGVEVWHVADAAKPGEAPHPSYYPRPGKSNVKVRLGVISATGGETVWIDWNRERYPYLTSVRWDKHGPLTLAVQTRDQRELVLLEADPISGRTTALLTERDTAWVSVRQDVPRWLSNERGFVWASEKDLGWQLEWRDRQGKLHKVLADDRVGLRSLEHINAETGEMLFTARPDPTQTQLCRVSLDGGAPVALTHEPGIHSASFSEGSAIHVRSFSALQTMPKSTVHRADGSVIGELPSVAGRPPFVPRVEIANVGGGAGFYAALVRPQTFKPKQRYPVIVNVYGGPLPPYASGMVTASMGRWLLAQWIADQGFIVVSLDGRGTPGGGHDWERAIGKRFGSVPLDDQVAGLQALGKEFRELDLKRVGIYGWSFGGYMSALGVLRRPDVFKAAVAGAPPTDWLDYDTHYTERYLGLPDTDAQAYEEGSLLTYAAGLRRPLLLIHGTSDDNVYFRHTLKLADALFRAGKDFDLLPLSSMTHMTPDPVVTERLYSRIVSYFQTHLGEWER
jgi:dipeptidyl-peptidase-4